MMVFCNRQNVKDRVGDRFPTLSIRYWWTRAEERVTAMKESQSCVFATWTMVSRRIQLSEHTSSLTDSAEKSVSCVFVQVLVHPNIKSG